MKNSPFGWSGAHGELKFAYLNGVVKTGSAPARVTFLEGRPNGRLFGWARTAS
ncbi:MAG: hypothetical protein LBI14_11395 [Treponema sp.]|nr:hypothetical protein [Treponema sp.]